MAIQGFNRELLVSRSEVISNYTQDYLSTFNQMNGLDLYSGTVFNFRIQERRQNKKINPIIREAMLEDVDDIIFTYKDIYEGTYPYKEMEDKETVEGMIKDRDVEWYVFTHPQTEEVCGCYTFIIDHEDKMGYARGLILKKKFIGRFDVLKACIGCYVSNYMKYDGKIFRWYSENRTAHAKAQYFTRHGGYQPVAFYPNKDMFFSKVESDILAVCYDERAISELRSLKTPRIVHSATEIFRYSSKRYNLGNYEISTASLSLNAERICELKRHLAMEVSKDRFGYEQTTFSIEGTDSCLSFLYTPTVQNIEKVKYNVSDAKELFVLARALKQHAHNLGARYIEAFVSAYEPEHQKVFLILGLIPRGYVPSWKYDKHDQAYEDCIAFNWSNGTIDDNIQLLDGEKELLRCLSRY